MSRRRKEDYPRLTPDDCDDQIARLTAENAKLREALTEIAAPTGMGPHRPEEHRLRAIARRALAAADTGEGRGEGWIACSERMPASGTVALIWSPYGNHFRVCRSTGSDWYVDGHGRNAGDFTHWRPLPAPPRTDDEKEGR